MKKLIILTGLIIMFANSSFATGTDALLYYNKALDYYKIGLYDQAIENFKKSISEDPDFIDAYYNLGSIYEFLQQYDEALGIFKQAVLRNPEDYDSVYHAAWLSYKLGEYDKAKMYLTLIPSDSLRSQDAQKLLSLMGGSLPVKSEPKKITNSQNNIFDEITSPTGIAVDSDGNIFVAQFGVNSITKITLDGKKILFIKNPKINGPIGIDFDDNGNLYIANYNDNNILKVSPGGQITVIITDVKKPYGLLIKDGILYVSMQGSNSVLKFKLK